MCPICYNEERALHTRGPMWSRADYLEVTSNVKRPRLDTNIIPPFDPIFKSDNVENNHSYNTMIPPQIMLQQNNLLHGRLIRRHAGCGHLLNHGRRLPRHGGHLQDGKRSEAREEPEDSNILLQKYFQQVQRLSP